MYIISINANKCDKCGLCEIDLPGLLGKVPIIVSLNSLRKRAKEIRRLITVCKKDAIILEKKQ